MTGLRNSSIFFSITVALIVVATGCLAHSRYAVKAAAPSLVAKGELVRRLELTDLCLFTEASYTRHLAMADLNTPLQDSPHAFEHFPSGALVAAPQHLLSNGATRITVNSYGRPD